MITKFCRWYLDTTSQPAERKIFSHRFRYYLWSRDAGRCQYCGKAVEPNGAWHIEHILPYSAAKNWYYINHESNLVVACIPCNMAKGTKLILPRGYYQLPPQFRRNVLKMMFRSNEMKLKTLIMIILFNGLFWLAVAFVLAVIL